MITHAAESLISSPQAPRGAVFVVAEHDPTRMRIAQALAGRPELTIVTGTSIAAVEDGDVECELLVYHCEMVQSHELALFGKLRGANDDLLIVAVCESANGRSTRRAIDGAVDGLVLVEDLEIALSPTVTAVLAGQSAVPRELRATLRKAALSFREKQILSLVVMGFTNNEIGNRLYLAESTVKSHLSSAFSKLGVKSRSEAATIILDPQGSLGASILSIAGAYDEAASADLSRLRSRG